jgi:hypothetical protein
MELNQTHLMPRHSMLTHQALKLLKRRKRLSSL